MICKYCGQELSDNSKFCVFCGHIIQRPEDMEIPVRVIHTTPADNQFEAYKPKHRSQSDIEDLIEIPVIESEPEPVVETVPEIEIINIEKSKEKEPMHHNEEKLKMIQDFDTSLNKVIKPDTEEILEGIANKAEKSNNIIEEISDIDESVEEVSIDEMVEENTIEEPAMESKEPEIVYLDDKGFLKKFSSTDKENKVLNALIIAFSVIVIVLALKTFVF